MIALRVGGTLVCPVCRGPASIVNMARVPTA